MADSVASVDADREFRRRNVLALTVRVRRLRLLGLRCRAFALLVGAAARVTGMPVRLEFEITEAR